MTYTVVIWTLNYKHAHHIKISALQRKLYICNCICMASFAEDIP